MRWQHRIGSDRKAKYRAFYRGFQRPTPLLQALLVTESQRRHALSADATAPVGRGNPCTFTSYEPGAVN